jgi:endonuclease I
MRPTGLLFALAALHPFEGQPRIQLHRLEALYVPPNTTLTARRSLEHVVPRAVLRDPRAAADLHNIFSTAAALNARRGCLRLDAADTADAEPGRFASAGHGNFVDRRRRSFCVEEGSRGTVARAILYVQRVYGCDPAESLVGGSARAWAWHAEYPPTRMELAHNSLVARAQGAGNFLVCNETRVAVDCIVRGLHRK